MIPQADSNNSLLARHLEKHFRGCCPYGCPRIEIDSLLAQLLAAWPNLDNCSTADLLEMAASNDATIDDNL